jgi:DNA-binding IclR family transcriptional regulator
MPPPADARQLDDRLGRVLGEYREMPGLSLTPAQAARLWGLPLHDADGLLRHLVATGFLTRTTTGAYVLNCG